ncbi:MAG: helix-turn-helix transcriptional regulator, partial [Nitrospinota bacterium]
MSIEDAGLGAYLRREREERGISIADVASSTRVRTFYIEKIEAEEFGDLPGVPICRRSEEHT